MSPFSWEGLVPHIPEKKGKLQAAAFWAGYLFPLRNRVLVKKGYFKIIHLKKSNFRHILIS
jgi:hypothetical protein